MCECKATLNIVIDRWEPHVITQSCFMRVRRVLCSPQRARDAEHWLWPVITKHEFVLSTLRSAHTSFGVLIHRCSKWNKSISQWLKDQPPNLVPPKESHYSICLCPHPSPSSRDASCSLSALMVCGKRFQIVQTRLGFQRGLELAEISFLRRTASWKLFL